MKHAANTPDRPTPRPGILTWIGVALLYLATAAIVLAPPAGAAPAAQPGEHGAVAPQRLADTGLYSDFASRRIAGDVLSFTPQYPLWTDGAAKQRWIRLPKGASIDGSNPDAWRFPVGTKLWKEFSFGRRVETRTMELAADGRWTYATYAWSEDGTDAVLAPEYGVRGAATSDLGTRHDIPGVQDCRACHTGGASEVLGFSALQLSSDRDPLAPHAEVPARGAVDLADLVRRGLLRGLPQKLVDTPPRIAASTPRERAALGYLHGNCGSCHNATGSLATLGMELDYPLAHAEQREAPAIRTTVGRASRYQIWQDRIVPRIEGGSPEHSTLVARVGSRSPVAMMPPLGSRAVDQDALDLLRAWIESDLDPRDSATNVTVRNASARSWNPRPQVSNPRNRR